MTRTSLTACLFFITVSPIFPFQITSKTPEKQQQSPSSQKTKPQSSDEENPPEEDESVAPEKFVLNPLESDRNIRVGNYYWNRKKFRAAASRYERATRYNPSSPEAFFKLGEANQKLKNSSAARIAYQKVMQLAPDSKLAQEARKKLGNKG